MAIISSSNGDSVQADLNKHFSRFEDPLWDEDTQSGNVVEVKIHRTKNNQTWKMIVNKKIIFVLDSIDLQPNIMNFLSTGDGLQFLIKSFKDGNDTILKMKKSLKQKINGK